MNDETSEYCGAERSVFKVGLKVMFRKG